MKRVFFFATLCCLSLFLTCCGGGKGVDLTYNSNIDAFTLRKSILPFVDFV